MNMGIIIIGVAFLIVAIFVINVLQQSKLTTQYKELPTMEEALAANSKNGKVICPKCGGNSFINWGTMGKKDSKRKHICNDCGNTVYRTTWS